MATFRAHGKTKANFFFPVALCNKYLSATQSNTSQVLETIERKCSAQSFGLVPEILGCKNQVKSLNLKQYNILDFNPEVSIQSRMYLKPFYCSQLPDGKVNV